MHANAAVCAGESGAEDANLSMRFG